VAGHQALLDWAAQFGTIDRIDWSPPDGEGDRGRPAEVGRTKGGKPTMDPCKNRAPCFVAEAGECGAVAASLDVFEVLGAFPLAGASMPIALPASVSGYAPTLR
jgi:hypothetical protein